MKKFITGGLLAFGALALVGHANAASSKDAAKTQISATRSDSAMQRIEAFNRSLAPAQRAALVKASEAWKPLIDKGESVIMARVQQDVARILTPSQARQFMGLVEPAVTGGGFYMSIMCFSSSKIALLYGLIGYIGCPSDISGAAAYDTYKASAYATTCTIDGNDSCESAVASASEAYVGWSTLITSCDVADTAAYTSAATYAFCGGTW